jgi:transposase
MIGGNGYAGSSGDWHRRKASRQFRPLRKVYVATRPIDFRKGHDGLAAAVQEMIGEDPFSGAVFVFRSKRADRLKVLVWDRTGLVLIHKRLEGGKFVWPQLRDGVMRLSAAQFAALFEGLEWRLVRPEGRRSPQLAG